jgi:hemerythrin-like domain-containing protein
MTLRQTIQAAPGQTTELIKKLSETTNQAVKTREDLFTKLSEALTGYVEIEEQHFLPMLRKHAETKDLSADAQKGNKELRATLKKLTDMPKGTDEFLAELEVLNKSFQQHVRNERKELLPAVLKAFSDEEASALADNIEAAVADAEKAKRDEKREKAAQDKREAEEAERAKADERAAARAQKAAERAAVETTEKAADTMARGTASVLEGARLVSANIKDKVHEVASDTREAMTVYNETTQMLRDDMQAIRASSNVSTLVVSEVYSAWKEWVSKAARINAEAAQNLMQARTLQQVAEQQNQFATSSVRNWMEGNAKVLEIALRSSRQALAPLNGRLTDAA